jgi:hypothetical protein
MSLRRKLHNNALKGIMAMGVVITL